MAAILEVLATLDRLQGRVPAGMHVRHLDYFEHLPSNIDHKFPVNWHSNQPDWVWVVEQDKLPLAVLIGGPMQNIAFFLRVASAAPTDVSAKVLRLLFRKALGDCHRRGYNGFMTFCNPSRPEERKLLRLIGHLKQAQVDEGFSMAVASCLLGDK